jgi:hypothetical protein
MEKEEIIVITIAILLLVFTFLTNTTSIINFLDEPITSGGLGDLCDSVDDCNSYCHNSRGQCENFCEVNPSTPYCSILYRSPF